MEICCAYCGNKSDKPIGAVKRAKKAGLNIYCGKICSGLGRRKNISVKEKKWLKKQYDIKYRELNAERIKKSKSEYFKKDYKNNPEKYRIIRKKKQQKHNEYCRQPEYKKWKSDYDKKYRAKKNFGDFWECFLIIKEIEKEYNQQEVRQINNLHNKAQKRKKTWQQKTSSMQRI